MSQRLETNQIYLLQKYCRVDNWHCQLLFVWCKEHITNPLPKKPQTYCYITIQTKCSSCLCNPFSFHERNDLQVAKTDKMCLQENLSGDGVEMSQNLQIGKILQYHTTQALNHYCNVNVGSLKQGDIWHGSKYTHLFHQVVAESNK